MTTPGGDQDSEDGRRAEEAPPVRGPVENGASSSSPVWIPLVAWGGALLLILGLSGLAAGLFKAAETSVERISLRWPERVERPAPPLDPPFGQPFVQALPGLPPAMPSDEDEAGGERGAGGEAAIIVSPRWLDRPRGDFPTRAQRLGVEAGEVELQCPVDAEGRIPSCWILNETPPGAGFGEAALAGAVGARLAPRTINGVATPGMVRFKTRFALE